MALIWSKLGKVVASLSQFARDENENDFVRKKKKKNWELKIFSRKFCRAPVRHRPLKVILAHLEHSKGRLPLFLKKPAKLSFPKSLAQTLGEGGGLCLAINVSSKELKRRDKTPSIPRPAHF